ncbi:MAG: HAD hydrolase-like protein [Pseudomonadota bacterium]
MKAAFLAEQAMLTGQCGPQRVVLRCGAAAALRLLARLDYRLFAVTVDDGRPAATAQSLDERLADLLFHEQLELAGFCSCPCGAAQADTLVRAAREHGVELGASWMIGVTLCHVEAGNRAGCHSVLLDQGAETAWRLGPSRIPSRMATDLYGAAVLIAAADDAK